MIGKFTFILFGLLVLTTISSAQSRRGMEEPEPPGSLIDIDTELGKEKEEVPEESGSGRESDDEDEEEEVESGSGSGDGGAVEEVKTTTPRTLTPCQNLYETSKHLLGNYVPQCDENGDYGPMQCRGHATTGKCWCVDKSGAEIPGTVVDPPNQLDCETGKNLSACLFRLVKTIRNSMLGAYIPKCKLNGDFEERQCHGSVCFCVQENGEKILGTERPISSSRNMCPSKPTEPTLIIPEKGFTIKSVEPVKTQKPEPTKTVDPGYTIASKKPNVNVKPPKSDDSEEEEEEADTESPNATGDNGEDVGPSKEENVQSAHIMTQPGLLAAIIGGAVVGLLCAILLVMFIVYRMRKKDEGSYALDEPRKKSTYSPINQSDKEFYA